MNNLPHTFQSIHRIFVLEGQIVWIDLQLLWNRAKRIWFFHIL